MFLNPLDLISIDREQRIARIQEWQKTIDFKWWEPIEYFSVWNLVVFFLFPVEIPFLQQLKFLMLLQTSIVGLYMTYVYPKGIDIHYLKIHCSGKLLSGIDFMAHQLPFFYSLFFHPFYEFRNLYLLIFLHFPIFTYLFVKDVRHLYQVRIHDMFVSGTIYIFILSIILKTHQNKIFP